MKEGVSDLKTFTNKGCKIATKKKVSFWTNFALLSRFFCYRCFSLCLTVFLTPLCKVQCPMSKLFRFSESLEKSKGKKWSQISKLLLKKSVKSPRRKSFYRYFFFFICSLCLNVFLTHFSKSNVQTF